MPVSQIRNAQETYGCGCQEICCRLLRTLFAYRLLAAAGAPWTDGHEFRLTLRFCSFLRFFRQKAFWGSPVFSVFSPHVVAAFVPSPLPFALMAFRNVSLGRGRGHVCFSFFFFFPHEGEERLKSPKLLHNSPNDRGILHQPLSVAPRTTPPRHVRRRTLTSLPTTYAKPTQPYVATVGGFEQVRFYPL